MNQPFRNLVTERSDSLAIGHLTSVILKYQIPDCKILDFKISVAVNLFVPEARP